MSRADCCPTAQRRDDRETVSGLPVSDLHEHQGMLKGFIAGMAKPTFWYSSGRISPLAETGLDLRMVR